VEERNFPGCRGDVSEDAIRSFPAGAVCNRTGAVIEPAMHAREGRGCTITSSSVRRMMGQAHPPGYIAGGRDATCVAR
jgi:hypothetical protein